MIRYKIIIEYDGSNFCGWQKQLTVSSVQEAIEKAIEKFSGEKVILFGAGRTDVGVHALGQVAHFDLKKYYEPITVKKAINHFVRPHISILEAEQVDSDFHARFSALKKRYIYKIINRDSHLCIMHNRAWLIRDRICIESMRQAATIFIGTHDFASFRAVACQAKNSIRTIMEIRVLENSDGVIEVIFEAKSFLHNQVRIMVSGLNKVATGNWSVDKLRDVLLAKDRRLGPDTAPASGLYLSEIWYE